MVDTSAAREYLETHKIEELFNNLTAQLFFHRPDDPKKFLAKLLQNLEESRVAHTKPPVLFDESNIESIFNMMDPTHRGHITLEQYKHAMDTLGIKKYKTPKVGSSNHVSFDFFFSQAIQNYMGIVSTYSPYIGRLRKEGMIAESSTYSS